MIASAARRVHGASSAQKTISRLLDRQGVALKSGARQRAESSGCRRPLALCLRHARCRAGTPDLHRGTGAPIRRARLRRADTARERSRAPVPHGQWLFTTFTGALRLSGLTSLMLLDGPMNWDAFAIYVEQVLAPTLRPDVVMILGNLAAHRGASVRATL